MSTRVYTKWTQKEKSLLKQLVKQQNADGKFYWIEISNIIQTRTPRQCYDQYILLFKTDKSGERHKWTEAEERQLLTLFQQNPYNWQIIQQHFQLITIKQLKNKYNQLVRTQKIHLSDSNTQKDSNSFEIQTEPNLSQMNLNDKTGQNESENTNQREEINEKTQKCELGELALLLSQYYDL
ncbi:Conserved_hypothetical protein [Hexamita inflata]|uniref:Myb-like DNA-binding domain-containing protein n=1 Tax=Hexamita inflata TaxID=28002 RepID=A0AA86TU24_9EUKA|nr:Conserved hypothetical protein [Hexamita inflata]